MSSVWPNNITKEHLGLFSKRELQELWWQSLNDGVGKSKTYRKECSCGGGSPNEADKDWYDCALHFRFNHALIKKIKA